VRNKKSVCSYDEQALNFEKIYDILISK